MSASSGVEKTGQHRGKKDETKISTAEEKRQEEDNKELYKPPVFSEIPA